MKTKFTMNAFNLYFALAEANMALSDYEKLCGCDLSRHKIIIEILKEQLKILNTSGDIIITMKRG